MESGTFQTATESWTWSVKASGAPGDRVVAKFFHCTTTKSAHAFSMERELGLDFEPVNDETARELLAHADTCLVRDNGGTVIARINTVCDHRAFRKGSLSNPPHQLGRLRIAVRGRGARGVEVTKPLGDHVPDELLEILQHAS